MSSGLKKILSFLFIALSITAVFFIAFSNEDLTNAWDAIKQMNLFWLAGIFGCWLVYTVCDGMNLKGSLYFFSASISSVEHSCLSKGAKKKKPQTGCIVFMRKIQFLSLLCMSAK